MEKKYYLFLDESRPNGHNIHHLCLAGVILEKNDYESKVIPAVKQLKSDIFGNTDIILHESEIRAAKNDYKLMRRKEKRAQFWSGMSNVFQMTDMKSIGSAIHIEDYKKIYHNLNLNDEYYIVLQIVLENFVHFLRSNNARGQVYIEGTNPTDDLRLRNTYHKIIANGTLYYHENAFQDRLLNINFLIKADNNIGLQLADFVPGALNRKSNNLKMKKPSILPLIEKNMYDGGYALENRFGYKVMPS